MKEKKQLIKRVRHLAGALFLSGAANIFLLALFLYWNIREIPPHALCTSLPPITLTQTHTLAQFRQLSWGQLVSKLHSTKLLAQGLTERDLALSTLVAHHHFDIERALTRQPLPKRLVSCEGVQALCFSGLSEKQFAALIHFAQSERWPVTGRKLFSLLQEEACPSDPSLAKAFTLTPEYFACEALFRAHNTPLPKEQLLPLLLEGTWEMLAEHNQPSLTRNQFILQYLKNGSPAAAALLVELDPAFTAALPKEPLSQLFALLNPEHPLFQQFASYLLTSSTSESSKELARLFLAPFQEAPLTPQTPTKDTYTVQKGDSLWTIARRFDVSLLKLQKSNGLHSDILYPGMILTIP